MPSISKSDFLKVLQDKCDIIQSYMLPDELDEKLIFTSEFRALVKDYFNLLVNFCSVPLAQGIQLEHKIKLSTPSWHWIENFIQATDSKKQSLYPGQKSFIFVENGRCEIYIHPVSSLKNSVVEAKRKIKDLNTRAFHLLQLMGTNDLNHRVHTPIKSDDEGYIFVDINEAKLFYRNKEIVSLMKTKLPIKLLKKGFDHKDGIPLDELTEYSPDEINVGIRNLKSNLQNAIKRNGRVSERIANSFIVKKPQNKIIFDNIFIKK